MNIKIPCILILLLAQLSVGVVAIQASENHKHNSHKQGHHHAEHDHHGHEGEHAHSEIPEHTATEAGITTKLASSGTLHKTVRAYGAINVPPERIIHVRARFPGIVKAVNVSMGDKVEQGDVLAIIESNESLKSYEIKSAMDGTIQHQLINVGELTSEGALFTIVNTEVLWAELRIFPNQREHIKPNQTINLITTNKSFVTRISHITASLENRPFVTARAIINNSEDRFFPGEFAEADITVAKSNVKVLIDNLAIQSLEGKDVVFVKNGDLYERRVVQLGASDNHHTEVISGLDAGEEYVAGNSYLIKADIEKSSAEHHH